MDEAAVKAHLDEEGNLDVSGEDLSDADLDAWFAFSWLAEVKTLDLSKNDLTDADVERASALPNLRKIVFLPPRIWGSAGTVDVVECRKELGVR